jgi:hypothetical protein
VGNTLVIEGITCDNWIMGYFQGGLNMKQCAYSWDLFHIWWVFLKNTYYIFQECFSFPNVWWASNFYFKILNETLSSIAPHCLVKCRLSTISQLAIDGCCNAHCQGMEICSGSRDGMLCKVDGANTNTLLKTNTLKSCTIRIVLYTLKFLRFGCNPA